jgi:hypothetical protein
MNTAVSGAAAPVWSLIGEGFTDFTVSFNPSEDERHYIHEKTARTLTSGFAKSIAYEMDMYSNDPVCKRIALAHNEEQTGTESQVEVLTVKYFDAGYLADTFFAKKQMFTISPDSEGGGNGGEVYTLSGTLNALGDPVLGSWDAADSKKGDGEFTPKDED